MLRKYSATEARTHFGELMRQAQQAPIVVERDGKPEVVVLSRQVFDQLLNGVAQTEWRELLSDAHRRIRQDLAGRTLPPVEDVLRQLREERDEYYSTLR